MVGLKPCSLAACTLLGTQLSHTSLSMKLSHTSLGSWPSHMEKIHHHPATWWQQQETSCTGPVITLPFSGALGLLRAIPSTPTRSQMTSLPTWHAPGTPGRPRGSSPHHHLYLHSRGLQICHKQRRNSNLSGNSKQPRPVGCKRPVNRDLAFSQQG